MIDNSEFLLTIVIPVHNMAGNLDNLKNSVSGGTNNRVKYIIVEDSSDDSTYMELQEIIKKNVNIHIQLVSGNFRSPGIARNIGLEKVDTPYMMFVDSDDKFYISEIEDAINLISPDTEVLIGAYKQTMYGTNSTKIINPCMPLHLHLSMNPGIWRMIFKTSVVRDVRFKKYQMAEDQLWLSHIHILEKRVELTRSILYEYFAKNKYSLTSNLSAKEDLKPVLLEFRHLIMEESSSDPRLLYTAFTKIWITSLLHSRTSKHSVELLCIYIRQIARKPKLFIYTWIILIETVRRRKNKYVED